MDATKGRGLHGKPKGKFFSVLCIVLVAALVFTTVPLSILNSKQAYAASGPSFATSSLNAGAKLYINGKPTDAVSNTTVLSGAVSDEEVTSSEITNDYLESVVNNQYSGDELGYSIFYNPSIPNSSQITSNTSKVSKMYWLSDTSSVYGINTQAIRNADNSLASKTYKLSGRTPDESVLENTEVNLGSYDLATGVRLYGDLPLTFSAYTYAVSGESIWEDGVWHLTAGTGGSPYSYGWYRDVYNNPYLEGSYYRANCYEWGYGNQLFSYDDPIIFCAYVDVNEDRSVEFHQLGVYGPEKINDKSGKTYMILIPALLDGFQHSGEYSIAFVHMHLSRAYRWSGNYGNHTYYVSGVEKCFFDAGKHAVRPTMKVDCYNYVDFFRSNTSGKVLSTSPSLGDLPTTCAQSGSSYKPVIKTDSLGITLGDISNASTDVGNVSVDDDGTINVPFGATTLTIPIATSGDANYISALTSNKHYGVVAEATSDSITLDLTNIINTKKVGSTRTVSLFAEQANNVNYADGISTKSASFKIAVPIGGDYTATYDLDGGSGETPTTTSHKAGDIFNIADGSYLNKEGNNFSCWKVSWVNDQDEEVSSVMRSGETFTMPNSDVRFTACYTSVSIYKDTTTPGIMEYKIIFDAGEGIFDSGEKKETQTVREGQTIQFLGDVPKREGYVLAGWKVLGTDDTSIVNVFGTVPTNDTTYEAIWSDECTISFKLEGGNVLGDDNKISYIVKMNDVIPSLDAEPERDGYLFAGWLPEGSKDGAVPLRTDEIVGKNPIGSMTYLAQWTRDCTITFDAGEGAFSGGLKSVSCPAKIGEAVETLSVSEPTRTDYSFAGWVIEGETRSDCSAILQIDDIVGTMPEGNITYTAVYGNGTESYFIAESNLTASELAKSGLEIEGFDGVLNCKKTASQIKADSNSIAAGKTEVIDEYKSFMTNDNYHLYTKLNSTGSTYSGENGWLECRIVDVQHDIMAVDNSKKAPLTFQATHSLPTVGNMTDTSNDGSSWEDAKIRDSMNSGTIYGLLNSTLQNDILSVKKASSYAKAWSTAITNDKVWLMSYMELGGTDPCGESGNGMYQYAFWKGKEQSERTALGYKRDGSQIGGYFSGCWWTRSGDPSGYYFYYVRSNGYVANNMYYNNFGIVPCFCL